LPGDPWPQIISRDQEQNCDLIVVGTHGMHVVEERLLGSVTKHVLAESSCDVLVLAPRYPARAAEIPA
jgi:nucleotide-binding universal stress UspA family protein